MVQTLPAPERLRRGVDRFLGHPLTDLVLIALIITAVLAVLAEEATRGQPVSRWFGQLSDLMAAIFAVELGLRFAVARSKRAFFARYWIDILAILPLYRALRLLRVLMLLRLFRAGVLLNRRTRAIGGVLRSTMSEVTIVATISATLILVGAMMVHARTGAIALDTRGISPDGLQGALWYSVFTLVGGEPIGGMPASAEGRLITLGLMLGGLTVFGVFVGTVSATMTTVLSQRLELDVITMGDLHDHLIVCGWNPAGPTMLMELVGPDQPRRPLLIISEAKEPPDLAELRASHDQLLYLRGDYTRVDLLEEASITKAAGAIILADKHGERSHADRDARTVLTALTIEKMSPGIFVCAELINSQHEDLLRMAGVEAVVIRDWYAGAIMGSLGRSRGMAAVISDLLTTTSGNAFHRVAIPRRLAGATIMALHLELKQKHQAVLVSLDRKGEPTRVNPPGDLAVAAGDMVMVIARQPVKL